MRISASVLAAAALLGAGACFGAAQPLTQLSIVVYPNGIDAHGARRYMGVVVTSSVKKSGSTISGNSVHIVVVKVNPGYAPSPSNHGTGTIVATFC